MSAQEKDSNGFVIRRRNPIAKAGVFPYLGTEIGIDDNDIYKVFRSPTEVGSLATLESMRLKPVIEDHARVGVNAETQPTIVGTVGETVEFDGNMVYATILLHAPDALESVESGIKELSPGFIGDIIQDSGEFNGQKYDYVQKNLTLNHLAIVKSGRQGSSIALLDTNELINEDKMMDDETKKDDVPVNDTDESTGNSEKLDKLIEMVTMLVSTLTAKEVNDAEPEESNAEGETPKEESDEEKAAKGSSVSISDTAKQIRQAVMKEIAAKESEKYKLYEKVKGLSGSLNLALFDSAEALAAHVLASKGINVNKQLAVATLEGYASAMGSTSHVGNVAANTALSISDFQ